MDAGYKAKNNIQVCEFEQPLFFCFYIVRLLIFLTINCSVVVSRSMK